MIFSFVSHRSATAPSHRVRTRASLPTAIVCAAALLASAAQAQASAITAPPMNAAPSANAAPKNNAAPIAKKESASSAAASTRGANQPSAIVKTAAAKPDAAVKDAAVKTAAPLPKANATQADAAPTAKPEGAAKAASTRASAAQSFHPATLLPPSSVGEKTLPNGVRGIVQPTPGSGVISIQVWVRAGSRYETNNESGAAHLVETVALRSSRLYPESADGPRGALEALGANASSQTTRDATSYSVAVAPRFFVDAMKIISDAVLHPRLQDTEVESSKAEVGSEISRRPVNGLDAATIDLRNAENIAYNAAFARHPYRHPPSGTLQNVLSLNAARVRAFHARRYLGKNISVVVSGEIDAATAQNLIAKNFADAKISAVPETKIAAESKAPKARVVTRRGYSPRPTTVLAYRSPSIAQPDDVVAMDVLLAYLGEGREASLRRILLGDRDAENAASGAAVAPASTREAAPNAIDKTATPDTPDIQPMPATMLEDRSPATSDAALMQAAPGSTAPAAVAAEKSAAPPTAQNAARAATPPADATAVAQQSDAPTASGAGTTAETATAEAPHIPPPPAVFLPQVGLPARDGLPMRGALSIAFSRAADDARVLAAQAKNDTSENFDVAAEPLTRGDIFGAANARVLASSFNLLQKQSALRVNSRLGSATQRHVGLRRRQKNNFASVQADASAVRRPSHEFTRGIYAMKNQAPRFHLVQDAAPTPESPVAPESPAPKAAPTSPVPPTATKPAPVALAFDTSFLTQRDNGIVAFSLVTENAQRSRAMQLVQGELRKVRGSGIGKDALTSAKTTLLRQYVQQGETPTGRAGALGFYDMIADYRFATTYIERIKRVTDADIRRVAARYFADKPLVTVLIESPMPPVAPPSSIPDDGGIIA